MLQVPHIKQCHLMGTWSMVLQQLVLLSINLEVVALSPDFLSKDGLWEKGSCIFSLEWPSSFSIIRSFIIFPVFDLCLSSRDPLCSSGCPRLPKFLKSMPLSGNIHKPVVKNNSVIYLWDKPTPFGYQETPVCRIYVKTHLSEFERKRYFGHMNLIWTRVQP